MCLCNKGQERSNERLNAQHTRKIKKYISRKNKRKNLNPKSKNIKKNKPVRKLKSVKSMIKK
jgi:hypothetical protein